MKLIPFCGKGIGHENIIEENTVIHKSGRLPVLLNLRSVLTLLILFSVSAQAVMPPQSVPFTIESRQAAASLFSELWPQYKAKFVTTEGNLIDSYHNISHSEGQGTAMLFAVYMNDRQTFDLSWDWTKRNLQRDDGLFAWHWQSDALPPVTDYNNATDGDILIAWSLLLAYEKWNEPRYLEEGVKILSAITETLVVNFGGFTVLIPAAMHFVNENDITLNLSYYILPAFSLFAKYGDPQLWKKLYQDGLRMIEQVKRSSIPIPPDWLSLSHAGVFSFPVKQGAKTGYDAIRVPLYLAWCDHPSLLDNYRRFWKSQGGWNNASSWINLLTYERSGYKPEPGILAVRSLSYPDGGNQLFRRYPVKDYFSTSLILFSLLAVMEGPEQCAFQ